MCNNLTGKKGGIKIFWDCVNVGQFHLQEVSPKYKIRQAVIFPSVPMYVHASVKEAGDGEMQTLMRLRSCIFLIIFDLLI